MKQRTDHSELITPLSTETVFKRDQNELALSLLFPIPLVVHISHPKLGIRQEEERLTLRWTLVLETHLSPGKEPFTLCICCQINCV